MLAFLKFVLLFECVGGKSASIRRVPHVRNALFVWWHRHSKEMQLKLKEDHRDLALPTESSKVDPDVDLWLANQRNWQFAELNFKIQNIRETSNHFFHINFKKRKKQFFLFTFSVVVRLPTSLMTPFLLMKTENYYLLKLVQSGTRPTLWSTP